MFLPTDSEQKNKVRKISVTSEFPYLSYSNYPHIRNSIFHLRPKNVSYNMKLSGNEGQCFLHFICLYNV